MNVLASRSSSVILCVICIVYNFPRLNKFYSIIYYFFPLIIPIVQLQFNTGEASQNVSNQDDEELPV